MFSIVGKKDIVRKETDKIKSKFFIEVFWLYNTLYNIYIIKQKNILYKRNILFPKIKSGAEGSEIELFW